ncbi:hypothetical protein AGMMS49587_04490 [Spirochaetia bacterium]|nr:hypothetical protein AGMMS49587_04490 [Spirochaetia bacterium]
MFPLAPLTGQAVLLPGAENANRETLKTKLREGNIPFEERSLFAEYGAFGSSLLVSLPSAGNGAGESDEDAESWASPWEGPPLTFVLAIPLAGTGSAAGGAAELALRFRAALGFIEKIRAAPLPDRNVIVAFLGDEGSLLPPELQKRPHTGFRDLCTALDEGEWAFPVYSDETVFFMYLDIQDTGAPLVIYPRSTAGITSLERVKSISRLCRELNIPWSLAAAPGYTPVQNPDAIYISAGSADTDTAGITAEALGELLFRYAASPETGKNRDRRYAIIPLPGPAGPAVSRALIFLSEPFLVLAFLGGGAAVIAAALFLALRPRRFSKRRLVSVCAAVLLILGIGISIFFDIRLLPLWVLPFLFVILAFIFHRPRPLLICTILAYVSLAAVCGILYNRRSPPLFNTKPELRGQNTPVTAAGENSLLVDIQSRAPNERNFISKIGFKSDRRTLDIGLRSAERVIRFDLSLVSGEPQRPEDPFLIYDAPMPYRIDGEGRSVEFFLGEGPPNPLSLEIIISASFSGSLRAEALYLAEDEEGSTYVQRVIREIPVTR